MVLHTRKQHLVQGSQATHEDLSKLGDPHSSFSPDKVTEACLESVPSYDDLEQLLPKNAPAHSPSSSSGTSAR